jgi:hypothetical protein
MRSSLLVSSLIVATSTVTSFGCGGSQATPTTVVSRAPLTTARSDAQVGTPRPTGDRDGHRPHLPPGVRVCHHGGQARTTPAKIEGNKLQGDITTAVVSTVNGWVVGDCHGRTFVYAGSAGWKDSMGLALIVRFGHRSNKLGGGFIAVPDSGPLRITRAPRGPKVVSSAQRRGEIQFTSDRGTTGTIRLRDNTATLSTGEVIGAVPDVRSIGSG